MTWNSGASPDSYRRHWLILILISCCKHSRVTVNQHVEASQISWMPASHSCQCWHADLRKFGFELEVADRIWHLVLISVICFVLWLAFKLCPLASFILYFNSFLPWFQLMLSHCTSCFEHFDLLTFVFHWLYGSADFLIDSFNSFTPRWHQLLTGFHWAHSSFELAGNINLGYLLCC